jgi:D,D-heptose 1,7-bisphosphate phosphatase
VPRNNAKAKKKAVFLDRDGTIIRDVDNLIRPQQIRFFPSAARAIAEINKMGFLVIVVTNQPVIARGWATEKNVDEVHAVFVDRLKRRGATIDAIYYCPHHPDANLKRYRALCRCRKPNTGMIIKAAKELGITMEGSYMVGDRTGDILAGERAKLRTILVRTGAAGKDGKHAMRPDHIAKNLAAAVAIIKKSQKSGHAKK